MLDARQLTSLLKGQLDPDRFAQWLNESNTAELGALPSFIPAKDALRKDSETKVALERMSSLDVQTLPVVDEGNRFVGVVGTQRYGFTTRHFSLMQASTSVNPAVPACCTVQCILPSGVTRSRRNPDGMRPSARHAS